MRPARHAPRRSAGSSRSASSVSASATGGAASTPTDAAWGAGRSTSTCGARSRSTRKRSAPGEDRLLEMVDALARVAEQPDLAQLEEDRRGRRVDEVVAQRQLEHRAIALRDRDEARLVVTQVVQADPVDGEDLVRRRRELRLGAAPEDHGGDDVARARRVVVEP